MALVYNVRKGFLNRRLWTFGINFKHWYSVGQNQTIKQLATLREITQLLKETFNGKDKQLNESHVLDELAKKTGFLSVENYDIVKQQLVSLELTQAQEDLRANMILHTLIMNSGSTDKEIYCFIVDNLSLNLNNNLLETYVYNLIASENLPAATTLLHIMLKNLKNFKLSNEMWSFYMSKVCSASYYHGASLIYHELVDNYNFYSEERTTFVPNVNSHIPFLISNSSIESLAMIFSHNKDPEKVQGLLSYFKRFYSYLGHRSTFKTLKMALVEAYSNKEDINEALKSFRDLSLSFQGNINPAESRALTRVLSISCFNNFRWRRDNIKNNNRSNIHLPSELKNEKDIIQETLAEGASLELFNPSGDRNVYTSPQTKHLPIIQGTLQTIDLPYFDRLIFNNVKILMESNAQHSFTNLMNFITSCHSTLQIFVVSSLCKLGYLREAFSIIIKLSDYYPSLQPSTLIKDENFTNLFRACEKQISSNPTISQVHLDEVMKLCFEIKAYYINSSKKRTTFKASTKVYECFLSSILSTNILSIEELRSQLDQIIKLNPSINLFLDEPSFDSFKNILNGNEILQAKYLKFIKRRNWDS